MPERWDELQVDGQAMRTFTASPDGPGPFPAVVVIQHAAGVDTFIEDVTGRLAAEGYFAVAPDLYHRLDPNAGEDNLTRMGHLRDDEAIKDVNTTVEFLRRNSTVTEDRIGITGFCMGGRMAFLMAAASTAFKAAVPFYAALMMRPWGDGPAPVDQLASTHCPVLAFFGEEDQNPSSEDRKRLDAELTRHGKEFEFVAYPEAGHAFMDSTNQNRYRKEAANAAWPLAIEFFGKHLKTLVAR